MLVCDQVIRDQGSSKASLIGISIGLPHGPVPAVHASLVVFLSALDAQGEYQLRLELVHVRDAVVVGRGDAQVTAPDRSFASEWIFNLLRLEFQEAGQ